MYFQKQLKQSGTGPDDSLNFYIIAICPLHLRLTDTQSCMRRYRRGHGK